MVTLIEYECLSSIRREEEKVKNICDKKWNSTDHILFPFQSTGAITAGVENVNWCL